MQPLDYETPCRPRPRASLFWIAFCLAYFVSTAILNEVDDLEHVRSVGHHSDGGAMALSFWASPIFVIAAGITKSLWHQFNAPRFAVAVGVLAPWLVYLALILYFS